MHHQPTFVVAPDDSPFDTTETPADDIAILGELAPSHTPDAWVAGPEPGFIAPTATAGGDAPPITNRALVADGRSTASTTARHQPTPHTFAASNRTAIAAVIVMTSTVISLAIICVNGVTTGSIDWLMVAVVVVFAVMGLAAPSAGSLRRLMTDRALDQTETGATR